MAQRPRFAIPNAMKRRYQMQCHRESRRMRALANLETTKARRASVILLLVLFLLPIVSAWTSSGAWGQAALPACCRTHGRHHCSMGKSGIDSSEKPGNVAIQRVPERCPFQGASSASHLSSSFGTASGSPVEFDFKVEQARTSNSFVVRSLRVLAAHPKRGPPHSSTLSQEA